MKKLIAYYRVSTKRQGRSGLGLKAQQSCIKEFAERNGYTIHQEFEEIESGTDDARPQLQEALRQARAIQNRAKAKRKLDDVDGLLVIAKLDRLARNVAFTAAIMDSGVEFVCCDNPNANRLTLHILAAVAENEAKLISERTKAALAAARRKGKLLGSRRPGFKAEWQVKGQRASIKAQKVKRAAQQAEHTAPFIDEIRALRTRGESYGAIARVLNDRGEPTVNGGSYDAKAIYRLLKCNVSAAK